MEGMGVIFAPVIGRHLLTPFKHVWAYGWHFLGPIASPNSPNRGFNPSPASHPIPPPAPPPPTPITCHQ